MPSCVIAPGYFCATLCWIAQLHSYYRSLIIFLWPISPELTSLYLKITIKFTINYHVHKIEFDWNWMDLKAELIASTYDLLLSKEGKWTDRCDWLGRIMGPIMSNYVNGGKSGQRRQKWTFGSREQWTWTTAPLDGIVGQNSLKCVAKRHIIQLSLI